MEAIREIREIHSGKLEIEIPEEFNEKRVEIIVLPIEEASERPHRFSGFLKKPIQIEDFQMPSREERNAR